MQYDTLQNVAPYSSRSDNLKKKKKERKGNRLTMAFACDK